MSATTIDRNTAKKLTDDIVLPVAAATKLLAGAMGGRNAAGAAVHAADASGIRVLGRIEHHADNTAGASGDIDVAIRPGIYCWENDTVAPVTGAHVGALAFVLDNQTVSSAAGTHGVVAGIVTEVTAAGVWVDSRLTRSALSEAAGLTVTVANATVPDGDAIVTIQSTRSGRQALNVWFAATAFAAAADLGELTATTGTIVTEHTTDSLCVVVTDANGLAVLSLALAADGTVHAHAERNGILATGSAAITGV